MGNGKSSFESLQTPIFHIFQQIFRRTNCAVALHLHPSQYMPVNFSHTPYTAQCKCVRKHVLPAGTVTLRGAGRPFRAVTR